ncbi:hypothetical protein BpHYR1_031375 [Brachionus plicatilis]|uniref:Uncharacterized protein n=1 Tax=Brachionus plicatilis TaxID=10195 RepID=A0A3M7SU99_BRAPC|nr:hypothetical protein BpHYR1_031375 [Brachionus plicatilis]
MRVERKGKVEEEEEGKSRKSRGKKMYKLVLNCTRKDNFFVRVKVKFGLYFLKISHIQETMLDLGFTLRVVNTSLRYLQCRFGKWISELPVQFNSDTFFMGRSLSELKRVDCI